MILVSLYCGEELMVSKNVYISAMELSSMIAQIACLHTGSMSSLIVNNGTNATLMTSDSEGNTSGSAGGSLAPLGMNGSGSGGVSSSKYDESSGSSSDMNIFSGGSASGNGSAISDSGSSNGSASGVESGDEQYNIVSALLQVNAEDGGIQCSDAGQYECIAGVSTLQAGTISVNVSVAVAGKLRN